MERIEGLGPRRAPRVHRSVAEKRQIVELSLQPSMSVARAAQTAGVNANQVFKWRQDYRSGLLLGAGETATALIPVTGSTNCFPGTSPPKTRPHPLNILLKCPLKNRWTLRRSEKIPKRITCLWSTGEDHALTYLPPLADRL